MFRLIAIALTSTFLLLALFGTSDQQTAAPRMNAMTMMGSLGTEFGGRQDDAGTPLRQYVGRRHQPLRVAPEPDAGVLRILPYGARVELLDAGAGSFVQVRDHTGAVGFLPADCLSDSRPG